MRWSPRFTARHSGGVIGVYGHRIRIGHTSKLSQPSNEPRALKAPQPLLSACEYPVDKPISSPRTVPLYTRSGRDSKPVSQGFHRLKKLKFTGVSLQNTRSKTCEVLLAVLIPQGNSQELHTTRRAVHILSTGIVHGGIAPWPPGAYSLCSPSAWERVLAKPLTRLSAHTFCVLASL